MAVFALLLGAWLVASTPIVLSPADKVALVSAATKRVSFVRFAEPYPNPKNLSAEELGRKFITEKGPLFGQGDGSDLVLEKNENDIYGGKHLAYSQVGGGKLPVMGAQLKLHFDEQGRIYAVSGALAPGKDINRDPSLCRKKDATDTALSFANSRPTEAEVASGVSDVGVEYNDDDNDGKDGNDRKDGKDGKDRKDRKDGNDGKDGNDRSKQGKKRADSKEGKDGKEKKSKKGRRGMQGGGKQDNEDGHYKVNKTVAVWVHLGMFLDRPGYTAQPGYVVTLVDEHDQQAYVVVDGNDCGEVLLHWVRDLSTMQRVIFEFNRDTPTNPVTINWEEGDPFPGNLTEGEQRIISGSGKFYQFFWESFRFDSWNGKGASLPATRETEGCPNAYFIPEYGYAAFCDGVNGLDTVVHEWSHGVTYATSNLEYVAQPGALNEAYSDIWGATVSLLNAQAVQGSGDMQVRTANTCSQHIEKTYKGQVSTRTTRGTNSYFAIPASKAPSYNVEGKLLVEVSEYGCTSLSAASLKGKIALIKRGVCDFTTKALNAQNAGAIGVIIYNTDESVFEMQIEGCEVRVPTVMVGKSAGLSMSNDIRRGGVTVSMLFEPLALVHQGAEDSFRWLSGSEDPAFGTCGGPSAIRDLWHPECFGHPSSVNSDAFRCYRQDMDNGGVHINSGVANAGYAMLVDGSPSDGVSKVGLTKTAHIYWRAQSVYLRPLSQFADFAVALEQSCLDLVGKQLSGLTIQPKGLFFSNEVISKNDCNAVNAMIVTTGLMTPTSSRCPTLLQANTPPACPEGKKQKVLFFEDFETNSGWKRWSVANKPNGSGTGWPTVNWKVVSDLPFDRPGKAAFAKELGGGDECGFSGGTLMLTSPAILVPASGGLRLSFNHSFALELAMDGGNLWYSINGRQFEFLADRFITFNTYSTELQGGPNKGLMAFSGSDPGDHLAKWGVTMMDLSSLVKAGNSVRVQWQLSVDQCYAIEGWWVDDVTMYSCD